MNAARTAWTQRILLAASLVLMAAVSLWQVAPPSKDAGGFSTDAAMRHLRFIASEIRPVGSAHHLAVRDYLVAQFEQLGYEVQLQDARSPIPLSNVIARKPGQVPGNKAVMLAAHYDSVRWGPGAADDGAAVAALLEVARIMAGQDCRNDLIFLITDGEELGLWGARLFVSQHPWARDVGVVINFEARGTGGPSIMFETSSDNRWLIGLYAQHAPHPVCSSISYDIYRLMPNNTDFTIFRRAGIKGLGFAFIGGYAYYHTALDDPDHLDTRSLRHHGIQALALTQALAQLDLTRSMPTGDAVYFDVMSLFVVRYPATAAPIIAIVAAIAALAAVASALKRRRVFISRMLAALGILMLNVLIGAGLGWLFAWTTRGTHLDRHADLAILGYVVVVLLITAVILLRIARWISVLNISATGLIVWSVLAVASGFVLRGGSYLTAGPLLSATVGFIACLFCRRSGRWVILILSGIVPVLLLAPILYLSFLGLTLRLVGVLAVPVVLSLWLLPPQIYYVLAGETDASL